MKNQLLFQKRSGLMLILSIFMMLITLSSVNAQAVPPSGNVDTSTFDQILQPVWKIYNFVKYIATAIATLFIVFAGIQFMASGNDIGKRDSAKNTIAFVVVGMIVIWAAPFLVQLLAA